MTACELALSPDIELYFYGELEEVDRGRVEAHLRKCEPCRRRIEDLHTISHALEKRRLVETPPGCDWSGFMQRLESAVSAESAGGRNKVAGRSVRSVLYQAAALAATLALATLGIVVASRVPHAPPAPLRQGSATLGNGQAPPVVPPRAPNAPNPSDVALRQVSAEHLERSKLVVLGLAALDPQQTRASDWQYERKLAGELLDDTRLYRQVAQEHGMTDVARVMRDLETVLIETSMSDTSDRDALPRVQRLIAKRDLVVKMQLVAAN